MDFLPWKNNKAYTVGAELEVRLHNPSTMELASSSTEIFNSLDDDLKPFIHHEYLDSLLEIVTPVCKSPTEAKEKLKTYATMLQKEAKKKDVLVATSGTHALSCESINLVDNPRYHAIKEEFGILLKKFNICGLHVHVALSSSDDALRAFNFTLEYMPIFYALASNSAFFDGEDTKLLSFRPKVFEQLPRAGMPCYFDEYFEMGELFEGLYNAEIIQSPQDVWWDVRINPKFGTLELRACDASNDFVRIELLIALFQAICRYAQIKSADFLHPQIILQNRWNALKHGLDGIYQNKDEITTLKEFTKKTILDMEKKEIFKELGTSHLVKSLLELLDHPTLAQIQKSIYKKTGSLCEVEKQGVFK